MPISHPATPPPAAAAKATSTTEEMSSLWDAASSPAAISTGSPGPGTPIQLAAAATASPA
jgi:hypothetical protein